MHSGILRRGMCQLENFESSDWVLHKSRSLRFSIWWTISHVRWGRCWIKILWKFRCFYFIRKVKVSEYTFQNIRAINISVQTKRCWTIGKSNFKFESCKIPTNSRHKSNLWRRIFKFGINTLTHRWEWVRDLFKYTLRTL
jgi:hypothetical protein